MIRKLITIIILAAISVTSSLAQKFSHKEKYDQDFSFSEGIYLNSEDFKNNRPIEKSQINSNIDPGDLSYFEQLFKNKKISLYNSLGQEESIETASIWGFCSNGTVYINHNGEFCRVGIIGSICHFLGTKTVYHNAMPTYGYYGFYHHQAYQPIANNEPQQYIFSIETGKILEYNQENIKTLLMGDPELHDEFAALKRKKRNAKLFYYMRTFNEKHPLYVPVYE